jgi:predicted RNA-binding protein YlxR (DUF448 family)
VAPQPELLRFALVAGEAVPDPQRRLPGRGAYVHPVRSCLDDAVRRRAFARAFRRPAAVSRDAVNFID